MIVLTIDMDWAPDAVIADGIEMLDSLGAKATIFVTHKTSLLDGLDPERYEIALHPNYLPLLNGKESDLKKPLFDLLDIYPEAKGIRSHGLVQSGALHAIWAEAGMLYESHQYFPWQLPVFFDFSGLYRIPVYWSDSREIYLPHSLDVRRLKYQEDLPAVFVFHFVHLFLNSETGARYAEAKPYYHEPKKLLELRNHTSTKGARDFLYDLVKYGNEKKFTEQLCCSLVNSNKHDIANNSAHVWDLS